MAGADVTRRAPPHRATQLTAAFVTQLLTGPAAGFVKAEVMRKMVHADQWDSSGKGNGP
jgi:hypothetical protein